MTGAEVDALEAQSGELLALVEELGDEEWDVPTRCPGWTVKELVAHCETMMRRMLEYREQRIDGPAKIDRSSYYGYDPSGPREGEPPGKTFAESIRDRVIEEVGGRGPQEMKEDLREAREAMVAGVRETPADLVFERTAHEPIAFGEFVATRVLEFGIHAMDIGHATSRGERIVPGAADVVKGILRGRLEAELPAGMGWDDRTFILSGTGRRRLERNERFALGPLASRFPLLS